jgi:hypothetical protein
MSVAERQEAMGAEDKEDKSVTMRASDDGKRKIMMPDSTS